MPITTVAAVIAVADLELALAWYERLFGRPADSHPMDGLAEWHFTDAGAVQLVRDADRAGSSLTTIFTNDLEAAASGLQMRGVAAGPITTGTKARFMTLCDPEGNTITFAAARDLASEAGRERETS